jgi:hypothetical protein
MSDQNNAAAPTAPIETAPEITEETAPSTEASQEATPEALAQATANATPKQAAAIKKAIKSLKLKVDGKEFSEDLPFELPDSPEAVEYMQRQLQMAKMGQNRAQYASNIEREVKSFVENLRKNPRAVLSDPTLGVDLKNLAKEIIEEEIANAQKSPAQLEKEALEKQIRELKEHQEKSKKEFDQREFERLQEVATEQYDIQMSKALEGSDLPKSPYVIKKMADYMLLGLQNGVDISAQDVLPLVREEIQEDLKQMFQVMPDEVVEKLVGKDKIASIRKKAIARSKATPPSPVSTIKDVVKPSKSDKSPAKKQNYKDFFKI